MNFQNTKLYGNRQCNSRYCLNVDHPPDLGAVAFLIPNEGDYIDAHYIFFMYQSICNYIFYIR